MRLALLVALALVLAACGGSSHDHESAAIVESGAATGPVAIVPAAPLAVGDLSLPNAADDGAPYPLRPAPGRVLLVFFGFTNCPDVCPTTLADLRAAIRRLPVDQRGRVDVAFVTVDPTRDTPAVTRDYITRFFPDGAGLRTDDDGQLRAVATAFSAAYEVQGTDVTHTSNVAAVTPNGRVAVLWQFGTPVETIASGLGMLLTAVTPS